MSRLDAMVEHLLAEMEEMSRRIARSSLVIGPGGNLSVRYGNLVIITPTGYSFESVKKEDLVGIDLTTGERVMGQLKPSSETHMHLACYRARDDIASVLHTHPPYTVAVGTTLGRIPPMVAEMPVHIPNLAFLDYTTPMTKRLADAVAQNIRTTDAVFLKKHGMVVVGRSIVDAYDKTLVVEESARIYVYASMVGKPQELTEDEIRDVTLLSAGS